MAMSRRTLWMGGGALLVLILVGVFAWSKWSVPDAAPSLTEEVIAEPEEPIQWAWTDIPWQSIGFTPPPEHWVYHSRWNREFLVIPGEALPDGAPVPDEVSLYAQAAVIFYNTEFDPNSFSSWDSFVSTMAGFACARGTTEVDMVACDSTPTRRTSGESAVGPWTGFSLQKHLRATNASRGRAPFVTVRLGEESPYGILFYALDPVRGEAIMTEMVQSLVWTP